MKGTYFSVTDAEFSHVPATLPIELGQLEYTVSEARTLQIFLNFVW